MSCQFLPPPPRPHPIPQCLECKKKFSSSGWRGGACIACNCAQGSLVVVVMMMLLLLLMMMIITIIIVVDDDEYNDCDDDVYKLIQACSCAKL